MVNFYKKLPCYLCEGSMLGRDIGSQIGSGKFLYYICKHCTHENCCWATPDELVTDFEKETRKLELKINKYLMELGGILSL